MVSAPAGLLTVLLRFSALSAYSLLPGLFEFMRLILAFLLLAVVYFPRPLAAAEPPLLLVLGDSLSAARGMDLDAGWVHLLKLRLEKCHYQYRILNASISGDTTQGGVTRLPRLLQKYRPAIVIIELGANDGLRGIDPSVSRANLAALVRQSQASGARVLLAGIRLPPNYGPAYTSEFEAMYADIAREYGTMLVPFFMQGVALDPTLMQADNLHPNEQGQALLLANVWKVLSPALQR